MSEYMPSVETPIPQEFHELRVAVFDLSRRALAGTIHVPGLLLDRQPLNANGMPGIPHEVRARTVGTRLNLGLPAMDTLGILSDHDSGTIGYAVASREPINFRHFTVAPYDIDQLNEITIKEVESPGTTKVNNTDAKLLQWGFTHIAELRSTLGQ